MPVNVDCALAMIVSRTLIWHPSPPESTIALLLLSTRYYNRVSLMSVVDAPVAKNVSSRREKSSRPISLKTAFSLSFFAKRSQVVPRLATFDKSRRCCGRRARMTRMSRAFAKGFRLTAVNSCASQRPYNSAGADSSSSCGSRAHATGVA